MAWCSARSRNPDRISECRALIALTQPTSCGPRITSPRQMETPGRKTVAEQFSDKGEHSTDERKPSHPPLRNKSPVDLERDGTIMLKGAAPSTPVPSAAKRRRWPPVPGSEQGEAPVGKRPPPVARRYRRWPNQGAKHQGRRNKTNPPRKTGTERYRLTSSVLRTMVVVSSNHVSVADEPGSASRPCPAPEHRWVSIEQARRAARLPRTGLSKPLKTVRR